MTNYYVSAEESSFGEVVSANAIGGIVAGLVVALALALLQRARTPLLELRQVSEKRAALKYNGWFFPIELGRNWDLGKGTILTTPTPKASIEGDRMAPGSEKIVCLDYPMSDINVPTLAPGEGVAFSYRKRLHSKMNGPIPSEYPEIADLLTDKSKLPRAWKVKWLIMKP